MVGIHSKTCSIDRKSHSACVGKNLDQTFILEKVRAFFWEKKRKRLKSQKYQPNPIENPLGEVILISKGKHQNNDKIALSRSSDGAERATGAWTHQKWAVNNVSGVCEPCKGDSQVRNLKNRIWANCGDLWRSTLKVRLYKCVSKPNGIGCYPQLFGTIALKL